MAIVSLLGCGNREPSPNYTESQTLSAENTIIPLDSIISRGKLTVVTNNTPTSYFIYRGKPMGYQYELLHDFADHMKLDLEVIVEPSIHFCIDSVRQNKAHIVASGLTVTHKRKEKIDFTNPVVHTRQILIQKLPDNHKSLSRKALNNQIITEATQLAKKTVYVESGSAYHERLLNLSQEIGDTIFIETYTGVIDIDSAMTNVENGIFDYVVSDEYTARFFIKYHPNIDISTPISLAQNIAWGTPKNIPSLTDTLNAWISQNENTLRWAVIYDKYFKHNKNVKNYAQSDFNFTTGTLSPYDQLIRQHAETIGWDWLLLAAQISVESNFQNNAKSWVGAKGLMQIMPATFNSLSPSKNILDPHHNIGTGTKYNKQLTDFWSDRITDSIQVIKFALASYNIGKGHVLDAQRLAEKHGYNKLMWDNNVEIMIKKLSSSAYYRQPEVYYGYCRGQEAHNYVKRIFVLYNDYKNLHQSLPAKD